VENRPVFEGHSKTSGQGSNGYLPPKKNPDGVKAAFDLHDNDDFRQPPQAKAFGQ
jgi:hypothetical protein